MIPRLITSLPEGSFNIFLKSTLNNKLLNNRTALFEQELKRYFDSKHAVIMPSARIGIFFVLKALDIKKGDEVILSSYNSPIIANLIIAIKAKPIFVDASLSTYNIDSKKIEHAITEKTKVIIVTHTEGQSCEMNRIMKIAQKHKLKVIEDCAHAFGGTFKGKKLGTFGSAGIFSFGGGKHINTLGGGVITTNDSKIAEYCREKILKAKHPKGYRVFAKLMLSYVISKPAYYILFPMIYASTFFKNDILTVLFEEKGTTNPSRLDLSFKLSNFQAAIGLKQLNQFEENLKNRRENASILSSLLDKKIRKQASDFNESAFLNYAIIVHGRKKIARKLLTQGIDTQPTWMRCCTTDKEKNRFKNSKILENEVLYLPVYPGLKEKDMAYIAKVINTNLIGCKRI